MTPCRKNGLVAISASAGRSRRTPRTVSTAAGFAYTWTASSICAGVSAATWTSCQPVESKRPVVREAMMSGQPAAVVSAK